MICRKCQTDNAEDAKFCKNCASSLTKKPTSPVAIAFLILLIGWAAYRLIGTGLSGGDFISDPTFIIQVRGTEGLEFHGSYMVTVSGSSQSQSVEGTVPKDYTVTGRIVSTSFQKQHEDGTLRVLLVKNGEVVKQSETEAKYGMVLVASR